MHLLTQLAAMAIAVTVAVTASTIAPKVMIVSMVCSPTYCFHHLFCHVAR